MSDFVIITNNPLVKEKYSSEYPLEFEEGSFEDTLRRVRDRIYAGHKLLTHPLSGSVKPKETPYKSVLVSRKPGKLDLESVELIEDALAACSKFSFHPEKFGPGVYGDFQLIDCTLLESALPSATCW